MGVQDDSSHDVNGVSGTSPAQEQGLETDDSPDLAIHTISITLPSDDAQKLSITVSAQEQVHEIRQSIMDMPAAFRYTCFHLEYRGDKINDFIPLAEIPDLAPEPEFRVVQDPYTEKEARIHVVRIRELIGAAGDRTDGSHGTMPGASLFESVAKSVRAELSSDSTQLSVPHYDFDVTPSLLQLLPEAPELPPKTVKSIGLSAWNPPPPYLQQRGHLLYLVVTTNEGEQFQITSHVSGFFVNKSSNAKFDPLPKAAPKDCSAHSLLDVLGLLSASFDQAFLNLQEQNNGKDPLATFQISNAVPAAPWIVPSSASSLCAHFPDSTRSQETYLMGGVENTDTLRDWNEELQSAKELPKDTVQDRVFRERLVSKLFADYTDAAIKGAMMVSRGDIASLNPTECRDAQIFVYNNIFFSFGADGVGTFTSEGGDEAARVATSKDVAGVKLINQLDIDGLFAPATVVIDYLGRRIVGQSIVPGIFKHREPGENQIDYGAVDGRDVVAADARFAPSFAQLSKALRVKKHPVWDKDGKRFDLEGSVETKGLMGTDGRKYVLDLYRVTPLDTLWLEENPAANADADNSEDDAPYPHRMAVLRTELVNIFGQHRMKLWVEQEVKRRQEAKDSTKISNGVESPAATEDKPKDADAQDSTHPDLADFDFSLNPDAYSGQVPSTDEERTQLQQDEEDVRQACQFLRDQAIPDLLHELRESDISFPMDGQSLSRLLHKRGINIRYLGRIATLCNEQRLSCLRDICLQDMVARSFKHAAASHLRNLPGPAASACISHLLNCLLGYRVEPHPSAKTDPSILLFGDETFDYEKITPQSIRNSIEHETWKRFRFTYKPGWFDNLKPVQLLREICLSVGIQLQARDFNFGLVPNSPENSTVLSTPEINGQSAADGKNGHSGTESKKKKKKTREGSPALPIVAQKALTFSPDDIMDFVPLVKHSCPRSALAEEALEAGRISLMQGQKKLGQELLLESLSLHEQIYGVLHPEVARVYTNLSMLYYQLDDRETAIELARKAIIVAERTVGIDSAETLLNYLNLSLFLHQSGDSRSAMAYSKHALMLWKIIYGPDHPDSITTINNAAVMLQNLKEYHESRLWFEESLRICESVFGKQSVNSATLLFQLAQALALDHEAKAALQRMRESYNIFLAELGAEDKNTKEAEGWLETLTQNAVNIAKQSRAMQGVGIKPKIRFPTAAQPSAPGKEALPRAGGPLQMDSRSIDELIKFIEGSDQKSNGSKKRPSKGHPKRRSNVGPL